MKTKTLILIIVAILLGLGFIITLSYPIIKESFIKSEINKANYCTTDSDCVDAGSKCPFGCYAYVNKAEAGKIAELINSYDSKCIYSCLACPTAICENNKCKEVCQ